MATYTARTALPYPHLERATAGLRADLRRQLTAQEGADWATFTVTGPVEQADGRGRAWFEYTAKISTATAST